MNRKLKVLGLAFLAVFAMSALTASAAQAQLKITTSGPTWLTFESSGTQTFTAGSVQVTCSTIGGHATVVNNQTEVTATNISYTNCDTSIAGTVATITMNGCDYKFHGGETDSKDSSHGINAEVDLVCPGGGPIIDIYQNATTHAENKTLCKLTVTAFTNKKGITYTNTPETLGPPKIPNDFDLNSEVVTNFTKEGSILCPASGTATYKGNITVTGFKDLGTNADGSPNEGERTGVTIS